MLQVTNWLLVTFYLAPNHFVIEIKPLRDIAFELIDTMNSLSGKGVKCRVLTPTSLHWQAGLTCLFTPQNSTVNSCIHVLGTVTYYVILVCYRLNSRVNSLLLGLDGTCMTISVEKHLTFPMWMSSRVLLLYLWIRSADCLLHPSGSPAAANGVVCSLRFFLIC